MAAGAIEAGKAFVKFLLDDKQFSSGLARAGKSLRKWGAIGLAATGPLIAAFGACVAAAVRVGGQIDDMSKRTGLGAESISELRFAAAQTGTDLGAVERAAKALQQKGINPLEFDRIAAELAAIPDHTLRAQKAMEVFGARVGQELLPLLQDLPRLREEARRLGVTMSTEDVAAADALGDAWSASKMQLTALAVQIGVSLAGPLTSFLQWSQEVISNVIAWVKENPRLVRTIAAVAAAIAATSATAVVFGTVLTFITFHPIIAALTAIAAVVAGIAAYFGLASDAGGDFKKSLDGIKAPSGAQNAQIQSQAMAFQSDVNAAMSSSSVSTRGPLGASTIAAAERAADDFLRQIAGSSDQQVTLLGEILRAVTSGRAGLIAAAR